MRLRWNNGVLDVGWLVWCDCFGIELSWGRRDLLEGGPVPKGETWFADNVWFLVATRQDVEDFGFCNAVLRRIVRRRLHG